MNKKQLLINNHPVLDSEGNKLYMGDEVISSKEGYNFRGYIYDLRENERILLSKVNPSKGKPTYDGLNYLTAIDNQGYDTYHSSGEVQSYKSYKVTKPIKDGNT